MPLAAVGYAALCYVINNQLVSIDFIRASGRQGMYSQKIAMLATGLLQDMPAATRDEDRKSLVEAIGQMGQAEEQLTKNDPCMVETIAHWPQIHALFYDPPAQLDLNTDRLLTVARRVAQAPAAGLTSDNPDLAEVRRLARAVLPNFIAVAQTGPNAARNGKTDAALARNGPLRRHPAGAAAGGALHLPSHGAA